MIIVKFDKIVAMIYVDALNVVFFMVNSIIVNVAFVKYGSGFGIYYLVLSAFTFEYAANWKRTAIEMILMNYIKKKNNFVFVIKFKHVFLGVVTYYTKIIF